MHPVSTGRGWLAEARLLSGDAAGALNEIEEARRRDQPKNPNFYVEVLAGLAGDAVNRKSAAKNALSKIPAAEKQAARSNTDSEDPTSILRALLKASRGVRRGGYETSAWLLHS